ncbi:MAG: Maf family protein [Coriobacteriia bacterium]|nr:Maf family protein [Coriobacteriia bacterium]
MACPSHPLLLASASPRRRRLVAWLGVAVDVTSVDTTENLDSPLAADPAALATFIAAEKARAAAPLAADGQLVLACDTIVVHEGAVLGKPADIEDAYRMLRSLSGREHSVITGIALLGDGDSEPHAFPVVTRVRMRNLSEEDLVAWAAKGELLGCAGAYNIESHLATVELTECYRNVAGLPLCHIYLALASGKLRGVPEELESPLGACDTDRCVSCLLGRKLTFER